MSKVSYSLNLVFMDWLDFTFFIGIKNQACTTRNESKY